MFVAHGEVAPRPEWPASALAWPFEPLVWVLVAVSAWLYLRSASRVPSFPKVRRVHFLLGLGALALALASPIAVYEGSLFWVHMVQHLLLTMIAAPLLLLGTPVTLGLRASSATTRVRLSRLLHARPPSVLTHPVVTWSLFAAMMWATHFSPLYDASLENEVLHLLEHSLYLGVALLFWWPVVGLEPGAGRLSWPARLGYLAVAMPQQSFLGLAIYSAGSPLYDHYATASRTWGPAPLDDQRLAGIVMWVGGDFLFLFALALGVLAWMRSDTKDAARIDRRLGRARP